jgi:beta-phosphoglucomutase-like phosphatase (HAD superfamily)
MTSSPAFLFDLDGTLVDSVYQHVLAWREALHAAGVELDVWRIHRRIGMSGGLLINALLRETGHPVTTDEAARLARLHAEAYAKLASVPRQPGDLAWCTGSGRRRDPPGPSWTTRNTGGQAAVFG